MYFYIFENLLNVWPYRIKLSSHICFCICSFLRFYLFILERGDGRKKEKNINVWLLLTCPPMGTWPTTQACALTGNQTSDPLAQRLMFNPLSHTSQGSASAFNLLCYHPSWNHTKTLDLYSWETKGEEANTITALLEKWLIPHGLLKHISGMPRVPGPHCENPRYVVLFCELTECKTPCKNDGK